MQTSMVRLGEVPVRADPFDVSSGTPQGPNERFYKVNVIKTLFKQGIIAAFNAHEHNVDHDQLGSDAWIRKSNNPKKLIGNPVAYLVGVEVGAGVVVNAFEEVSKSGKNINGELNHSHGTELHPTNMTSFRQLLFARMTSVEVGNEVRKAALEITGNKRKKRK